jgi:aspartate aminotransferase
MQDNPDNLVVLDSLSKRYSAPGLRLGMLVSLNTELMAGVLRMAMGRLSAGIIDQRVAAQLKQVSSDNLIVIREEYRRRRDVVYEGLKDLSGVTIREPEGAFYCVVELPVPDAEAFCAWMLTDFEDKGQTVMLAPMAGFYATPGMGKNEVRLAYVVGVERLQRSVELLKLALKRFQ